MELRITTKGYFVLLLRRTEQSIAKNIEVRSSATARREEAGIVVGKKNLQ